MAPPRIPPIHCLLSFEALARLRSVTLAADELNVTPSAVSHRMRQLESQLGVQAVRRAATSRSAPTARPTSARCARACRRCSRCPAAARRSGTTRLRLAVTPTFSRQMLLPRLALFRHAYPDVELILQVSIPLLDVTAEDADLEIRYGTGPYAGRRAGAHPRRRGRAGLQPRIPARVRALRRLRQRRARVPRARLIRSPLEPWSTWFEACGIDAARAARGRAVQRRRPDARRRRGRLRRRAGCACKLGRDWLDSGRLVRLSPRAVPSPHHHYLCWKPGTLERWECAAFVDWLQLALA